MAFSLFTKSSTRISRRLRWLGRGFQLWAALSVASVLSFVTIVLSNPALYERLTAAAGEHFVLKGVSISVAGTLSLYLTGRALLRRQRTGLYAAAVIVIVPFVYRAVIGGRLGLTLWDAVVGIGAAFLIASVWKEVHTDNVELDDVDDPDDDALPLTPRNRGFGEPRVSERFSVSGTKSGPAALQQAHFPPAVSERSGSVAERARPAPE